MKYLPRSYNYYADQLRQMATDYGRGMTVGLALGADLEPYEIESLKNLAAAYYLGIKP